MGTKILRYFYSAKQSRCMDDMDPYLRNLYEICATIYGRPREYRRFVKLSIADEVVEVEYTECSSNPDYWPNWDDTVLLGAIEGYPVRIEEISEYGN